MATGGYWSPRYYARTYWHLRYWATAFITPFRGRIRRAVWRRLA